MPHEDVTGGKKFAKIRLIARKILEPRRPFLNGCRVQQAHAVNAVGPEQMPIRIHQRRRVGVGIEVAVEGERVLGGASD